jgi:hypothetical protein
MAKIGPAIEVDGVLYALEGPVEASVCKEGNWIRMYKMNPKTGAQSKNYTELYWLSPTSGYVVESRMRRRRVKVEDKGYYVPPIDEKVVLKTIYWSASPAPKLAVSMAKDFAKQGQPATVLLALAYAALTDVNYHSVAEVLEPWENQRGAPTRDSWFELVEQVAGGGDIYEAACFALAAAKLNKLPAVYNDLINALRKDIERELAQELYKYRH